MGLVIDLLEISKEIHDRVVKMFGSTKGQCHFGSPAAYLVLKKNFPGLVTCLASAKVGAMWESKAGNTHIIVMVLDTDYNIYIVDPTGDQYGFPLVYTPDYLRGKLHSVLLEKNCKIIQNVLMSKYKIRAEVGPLDPSFYIQDPRVRSLAGL